GRKNPFTGIHPSPGTKGLLTPLRGWRVSGPVPQGLRPGPVPQGLRPGLFSSAPNGASNRARTRLARREELGIKAKTRVEECRDESRHGRQECLRHLPTCPTI